jgi:serine/threonine protein kinase
MSTTKMLKIAAKVGAEVIKDALVVPKMKIVEREKTSSHDGSNFKTWVLAVQDSKLYIAIKKGRVRKSHLDSTDPSTWAATELYLPPYEINLANLYPVAKSSYHRYQRRQGEGSGAIYKKHQEALQIASDDGDIRGLQDDIIACITAREINICELIRANPHPNVAEYRGAICDTELDFKYRSKPIYVRFDRERVVSLVFKRYDCTLWDMVDNREKIDARCCLQGIAAGLSHFHRMGLAHCDIKPDNIFVDKSSGKQPLFVVGDFDSAQEFGATYQLKGGALDWSRNKRHGVDIVEADDDWFSFQILKQWLIRETGARERDVLGIGRMPAR